MVGSGMVWGASDPRGPCRKGRRRRSRADVSAETRNDGTATSLGVDTSQRLQGPLSGRVPLVAADR